MSKAECLINQFRTNTDFLVMGVLKPVLEIINPRATIIEAKVKRWKVLKNSGKTSKSGYTLYSTSTTSRAQIATFAKNKELEDEIKEAAKNLCDHLQHLITTYDRVSKKNNLKKQLMVQ